MALFHCPFCDKEIPETRGFCFCKKCALVFNTRWQTDTYGDAYFTDVYRQQYGKSYEEDFDAIYAQSMKRLSRIAAYVNRFSVEKKILDLGCAYGFFLKAAQDNGFSPHGIELSAHAVAYANKNFDFPVENSSLEDCKDNKYPVLTFWYVLEHFREIRESFDKVCSMVEEGGVIAFSVPSWFGPSYLFHRRKWEKEHPKDHRADFSPKAIRQLLRKKGFGAISIVPASFHPERLISRSMFMYPLFAFLYRLFSYVTGFGDTIEVYACKRK